MNAARTLANLRRSTVTLVIDHVTPHFGLDTVSIHVLEVDADDRRQSGFDIDQVTKEELGIPADAELLGSLTEAMLTSFVADVAEGLPVMIDVPAVPEQPPADEEDAA
jgi:hypothetical protein